MLGSTSPFMGTAMKDFEYNGYIGSAEVSLEDQILHGRILFIQDTVTYEAADVRGLERAFREAVDSYIETCRELGRPPEDTCKGSFNVRMTSELHRSLSILARQRGKSLNEVVNAACHQFLERRNPVVVNHEHRHTVVPGGPFSVLEYQSPEGSTGSSLLNWRVGDSEITAQSGRH